MNKGDIFVILVGVIIISMVLYIGYNSQLENEQTFDLCVKAGYEMGMFSPFSGHQCEKETCNIENGIKICTTEWLKFSSIEEVK